MRELIASRIFGRPLLIHPGKAEIILSVLADRLDIQAADIEEDDERLLAIFRRMRDESPAANRMLGEPGGPPDESGRRASPLYMNAGGVALIPIIGSLANRGAYIGQSSGVTSYEGLAMQIAGAARDPKVGATLLDIDSPGGEALGLSNLADVMRIARTHKPITAVVNDVATSAAYAIAAQANEIVVSPTSVTGSLGVLMVHRDVSKSLERRGIKPTLIFAGAHKVDGNPFEPLPESVRADLQAEVNSVYEGLVTTVASGRPSLSESAIRATEAKTYLGAKALEKGLADRVGTFADVFPALSRLAQRRLTGERPATMTTPALAPAESMTQAQLDKAIADARAEGHTTGTAEGRTAGIAEGIAQATTRLTAILTSEHAKDRLPHAVKLALGKASAEDAVAILADLPVTTAAEGVKTPPLAARGTEPVAGDNKGGGQPMQKQEIASMWDKSLAKHAPQFHATMPQPLPDARR